MIHLFQKGSVLKTGTKILGLCLLCVCIGAMLTGMALLHTDRDWQMPGNTSEEILSGGLYLYTDNGYYESDGGVWYRDAAATLFIADTANARNLNLSGGTLYYTAGAQVFSVPADGSTSPQVIYTHSADIDQLYVVGQELCFLSSGAVYEYDMIDGDLLQADAPVDAVGLMVTQYGNLYLTGSAFHYDVQTEDGVVFSDVTDCYTDGDWLVAAVDGGTYQCALSDLFGGNASLTSYTLHSAEAASDANTGMTEEQQLAAENDYITSAAYSDLADEIQLNPDGLYISSNSAVAYTAQSAGYLSTDQNNIILRARQMAEVCWTPLKDLYCWGGDDSTYVSSYPDRATPYATDGYGAAGCFLAGKTYQGIPYSQPVNTHGYVGFDITLSQFAGMVQREDSQLYKAYSYYTRTAPYYGMDCSGFVSWTWNLNTRCTCAGLMDQAVKIASSIQNLQVGDILDKAAVHTLLVTDLAYDSLGNIVGVEITEQIQPKVRVICYGETIPGHTYEYTAPLSHLAAYLTSYGYGIYRRNVSYGVSYSASSAVSLSDSLRNVTGVTGWYKNGSDWYYFDADGKLLTASWVRSGSVWYYVGADGCMLSGEWTPDGNYYLKSGGIMATGWAKITDSDGATDWYYFNSNGYKQIGWQKINGAWYYLGTDGKMYANKWYGNYYLTSSGSMATGWTWISSASGWYYFSSSGYKQTGWQKIGGTWYYLGNSGKMYANAWTPDGYYYLNGSGRMVTGWYCITNSAQTASSWYYFNSSGVKQTGWQKVGSMWYYLGTDGKMYANAWTPDGYYVNGSGQICTGWKSISGTWYYFNAAGVRQTGWQCIDGDYYYFGSDGKMYADTYTPDGYYVNASGRLES